MNGNRLGVRKVYQDARDKGFTKIVYTIMEAEQSGDTITGWAQYKNYKGYELFEEGTYV